MPSLHCHRRLSRLALCATGLAFAALTAAPLIAPGCATSGRTPGTAAQALLDEAAGNGLASAGARVASSLNPGWSFHRGDAAGAEAAAFDDSSWSRVDLPHTWNAQDGQDGPGTPQYRGVGWYRRHLTTPASLKGKRLYLPVSYTHLTLPTILRV